MTDDQTEQVLVERRRLTDRIIGLSVAQLDAAAESGRSRRALITGAIGEIADLGARSEGREPLPVPNAGDRALADQLAVMIDDVVAAGRERELDDALGVLVGLRRAL